MFSIVIITKGNRNYLLKALESIFCERPQAEIIVVEAVEGEIEDLPYPVKHIRTRDSGFSNQRNLGVKNSNGDWIIFVDDDVEVERGWFREIIKVLDGDALGGMGCTFPKDANILSFMVGVLGHPGGGFKLHHYSGGKNIRLTEISTCNTIIKKSVIEEVGYFDPFQRFGSEDTDLSIRIGKIFGGGRMIYIPSALAWHHTKKEFFPILKWYVRRGKADAELFLKHSVHLGYLIKTAITFKIFPALLLGFFSPIITFILFTFWYIMQLKRYKFMFKYFDIYKFRLYERIITFFIFPFFKLLVDLAFDFGRAKRVLEEITKRQKGSLKK